MLVLLAVAWIALAPTRAGGQSTFVIVNGNSMEPGFHRGDLAIVRTAASYAIGDIVTYRHPTIGMVIHRIVGRDGGRFVIKGDHNSWLDGYRPDQAEIVGKLWLHIPMIGKAIESVRTPRNLALVAGLIGALIMASVVTTGGDKKQSRQAQGQASRPAASFMSGDERSQAFLTTFGSLALVALLLGFFAFTRPIARTVSDDLAYQQTGAFSYTAAAPPGVYDAPAVSTGEPIFRRLATSVKISFAYHFLAEQPAAIHGTYRLVAVLSDADGWKRTFALQPRTAFSGGAFTAAGVLDLKQVQALLDRVEAATGIHPSQYMLAVGPDVDATGTVAGQELHDAFSPRLTFRLDPLQLLVTNDNPAGASLLEPSKQSTLKHSRVEPNMLSILSLSLSVSTARLLAILGLAVSLWGLWTVMQPVLRAQHGSEAARNQAQYGALLVAVRASDPAPGDRLVEVEAFADLVKVAETIGAPIQHDARDSIHQYSVQHAGLIYRYRAAGGDRQATGEPELAR
jgi:signal peptidase I